MSYSAATLDLSALPMWVIVVGAVIGIAQLVFEIWTLIKMLQVPEDRLTLGGRKWLWAIIILFLNWIGAILFWVVGRKPEQAVDMAPAAPVASRAEAAADALYGARNDDSAR
jgi:hypothetical protein